MIPIEKHLNGCSIENVLFFCGAGISYNPPTSLPTVYHFIESIINLSISNDEQKALILSKINNTNHQPRFEVLVDDIIKFHDKKKKILNIFDSKYFNKIHFGLGRLLIEGATIITTNFDCCIENSLNEKNIDLQIFNGNDLIEIPKDKTSVLIKPHGSYTKLNYSNDLIITISALAKMNNGFELLPNWRGYLLKKMEGKVIIFLGYSGSDDFDLTPLILKAKYKKIIWLNYNEHSNIEKSIRKSKGSFLLKKIKRAYFYKGKPEQLIEKIYQKELKESFNKKKENNNSLQNYLIENYPKQINLLELLSTILFHYGLYNDTLKIESHEFSSIIFLNKVRALFKLGKHDEICNLLNHSNYIDNPYELASILIQHHSTSLYYTGDIKKAEKLGIEYLKFSKMNRDFESQQQSLIQLGAFSFNRGLYLKSQRYYLQALSIHKMNIEGASKAYWGLGAISHVFKKYDVALDYYNKALEQNENLKNFVNIGSICNNIGLTYFIKNDFVNSKKFLLRSESIFNDIIDKKDSKNGVQGYIYSQVTLAKLFYKLNDSKCFCEKIMNAFVTLENCTGHPDFFEIVSTYLYSKLKFDGIESFLIEKNRIEKSEFNKIILKRNHEEYIKKEGIARELILRFWEIKEENKDVIKYFEKIYEIEIIPF